MNREEKTELIDKFLMNELEGMELARFKVMLESDADLKESLKLERELKNAINNGSDFILFKKLLKETQQEYLVPSKSIASNIWKVAVAIVLIGAFSFLIWQNSVTNSPEYIYAKYFEPFEAPSNLRSANITEMDEDFMLGLIKYNQQEYTEAITLFQKAYEKDFQNYTARFLTAIAYLSQKDFTKAEPILKELTEDGSHLFQDQAKWYLGLLYLTDEDEENDLRSKELWKEVTHKALLEKIRKLNL